MFAARSIPRRRLRALPRLLLGIGALLIASSLQAQGIDGEATDAPA